MEKFYFLTHDNNNPFFNLASEEYLLKNKNDYFIYLWINNPAVIVGLNQNTIEEVNLSYTTKKDIKVVRRLTGGGAVYHDNNNLCYTIIAPNNNNENKYKSFTEPVIKYLNSLGVKACFSGRNDIVIDGKKISGNAQTVYKNRVLHHGTLLFNTDMSELTCSLKENKLKIESKGIKSIRARVTNIFDALPNKMTINDFKLGLENYFTKDTERYVFKEEDLKGIDKLVREKYSTFEWNIGRSPKGKNTFNFKFDFGIFTMTFDTIEGKMQNVEIYGDFFCKKDISEFAKSLENTVWQKDDLQKSFEKIGDYIVNADGNYIVSKMFL